MDCLAESGVGKEIGEISAMSIQYRNAPMLEGKSGKDSKKVKTGFYSTIKSRHVVKQVVERILNSAALTFDYACMLTVASLIAVGGLAANSAVIVVASMLVSVKLFLYPNTNHANKGKKTHAMKIDSQLWDLY